MPIADEITGLAARTKKDLDNLSDFRAHTQLVWGMFKRWDREGKTLKSQNLATGTVGRVRVLVERFRRRRVKWGRS